MVRVSRFCFFSPYFPRLSFFLSFVLSLSSLLRTTRAGLGQVDNKRTKARLKSEEAVGECRSGCDAPDKNKNQNQSQK